MWLSITWPKNWPTSRTLLEPKLFGYQLLPFEFFEFTFIALTPNVIQITKVGHPARLLPSVLEYSLDARLKHADETELVNDVRKEILQLQQ